MKQLKLFSSYCIDTSALIDLKKLYPRDIFPSIWKNLEDLIFQGRLIAPKEVLKELERIEDELLGWVRHNRIMFKNLNIEQIRDVKEILRRFENLVDASKQGPHADPFVIALALSESCTVVTSERTGTSSKPKIPDVCSHFGIKCLSLLEFFREQKWEY